jgi:hypothetical protein
MYDTLKYSTVKYVLAPIQSADAEERTVRSFLVFAKALAAKDDRDSKLNVQIVRSSLCLAFFLFFFCTGAALNELTRLFGQLSKFAMVDDSENKERPARMKPDEVRLGSTSSSWQFVFILKCMVCRWRVSSLSGFWQPCAILSAAWRP